MNNAVCVRNYTAQDNQAVVNLLMPYFSQLSIPGRWEWEWQNSPLGSQIFVAEHRGRVIGHYSLIGYDMLMGGQIVSGGKIEGSCVDLAYIEQHKSETTELKMTFRCLIEAMIRYLRQTNQGIVFGFPNAVALNSQVRNGFTHARIPTSRFAVRLIPTIVVSEADGYKQKIRAVGELAKGMMSHWTRKKPHNRNYEVSSVESLDKREIDLLTTFCSSIPANVCTIARTKEFITWRYLDNPNGDHRVWRIARDQKVLALFVTLVKGNRLLIEDWIPESLAKVEHVESMVHHAVNIARQMNLASVEFELGVNSWTTKLVGELSTFMPWVRQGMRETIVWSSSPDAVSEWYMTDAFREGV